MSNYKSAISTYIWPGQLHLGLGAAELAGQEASARGAKRIFVVADPGVIAAGLLQPVEASLRALGLFYQVYDEVKPNPDVASVEAAAATFRESGADFIIGVGGGSAMDTAKAARLLADGQAHIMEYDLLLSPKAVSYTHLTLPTILRV